MNCWQRIREASLALFRKRKLDQELDEEMRSHVEMRTQANIVAGMSQDEARSAAMRSFGGMEQIKEVCRDLRGVGWIEALWQDARFGLRMARKNAGFTSVTILSLALGLTLSSVLFGAVDWIWLRPTPVQDPGRIVHLFADREEDKGAFCYPDYLELRSQVQALSGLAAAQWRGSILRTYDVSECLNVGIVSRNFFTVLGIKPHLGRVFTDEDDEATRAVPGIVLGYGLWRHRFGGDTGIIGRPVNLTGRSLIVLGVAPRGFAGTLRLEPRDVWYPVETQGAWEPPSELMTRRNRDFYLVGRLQPGASLKQARAQARTVFGRMNREDGAIRPSQAMVVLSETAYQNRHYADAGMMLLGVVGLILVIACANVSALHLAGAEVRQKEMAVRLALGSARGRLVRQLLTESLLVAVIAAAAGLLLTRWVMNVLPALLPPSFADLGWDVRLDLRLVAFTAGLTLVTAVLSGLAPAWYGSKPSLLPALRGDAAAGGKQHRRWSNLNLLITGQLALCTALMYAAGLLVKSVVNCHTQDLGFQRKPNVLLVNHLTPNLNRREQLTPLYRQVVERVAALPGVKQVSLASDYPRLSSGGAALKVSLLPEPTAGDQSLDVKYYTVDERFFNVLGIGLARGRFFSSRDDASSTRVALINETMARRFWPGQDSIGRQVFVSDRFTKTDRPQLPIEIIGIVKDGIYNEIDQPRQPFVFLPYAQQPPSWMALLVETTTDDATAVAGSVRREIKALRSDIDIYHLTTLRKTIRTALYDRETMAEVAGFVSLLGLMLAGFGLCGVVSYTVNQRTREMGIRMAMGATRCGVLRLVMSEELLVALAGIGTGGLLAMAAGRLLQWRGKLFEVSSFDPLVLLTGMVVIVAAVLLGAYWPARRAAGVDPMVALKCE